MLELLGKKAQKPRLIALGLEELSRQLQSQVVMNEAQLLFVNRFEDQFSIGDIYNGAKLYFRSTQ